MFAVLKTGGKQYRVATGDVLRVELLAAEAGDRIQFNEILMVGANVGTPLVAGAAVQADVIDTVKADKVITFHKRRRKHSSQRTRGHRQKLTLVRITGILETGAETSGVKAAVGTAGARVLAHEGAAGQGRTRGAPAKTAVAGKRDAGAVAGTRPGNLLEAARGGAPDDLARISGVGPKLEALLHENGVFHFDQIAAWNTDEIAYMDEQMSFRGRIAREGWIEQAKALAAEGEPDSAKE